MCRVYVLVSIKPTSHEQSPLPGLGLVRFSLSPAIVNAARLVQTPDTLDTHTKKISAKRGSKLRVRPCTTPLLPVPTLIEFFY